MKVFYSWQSWLPENINWKLIENAINEAIDRINNEKIPQIDKVVLVTDVQGEVGSVAIADTILRNISDADIFVCDATIVARNETGRRSPNPNILIELGYAVGQLQWENVIIIANTFYGVPEEMPFDLKHRRLITYHLPPEGDVSREQANLAEKLYLALRPMITRRLAQSQSRSLARAIEPLIQDSTRQVELRRIVQAEIEKVFEVLGSSEFLAQRQQLIDKQLPKIDLWNAAIDLYFEASKNVLEALTLLGSEGNTQHESHIKTAIKRWLEQPGDPQHPYTAYRFIPGLLAIYSAGIAATHAQNWPILAAALQGSSISIAEFQDRKNTHEYIFNRFIAVYEEDRRAHNSTLQDPLGKRIQDTLRSIFKILIPSDEEYLTTFEVFEMLFSISFFSYTSTDGTLGLIILPYSRAGYNVASYDAIVEFWKDAGKQGDDWEFLKTGLLGASPRDVQETLKQYHVKLSSFNYFRTFPRSLIEYHMHYTQGLIERAAS